MGFGNGTFTLDEFVAKEMTIFFNVDVKQVRRFELPGIASDLILNLSIFKIRKFLSYSLRLRAACDLKSVRELEVIKPSTLHAKCRDRIERGTFGFRSL